MSVSAWNPSVVAQNARLPTPSLRAHYFTNRYGGDDSSISETLGSPKLGSSVSLPVLPQAGAQEKVPSLLGAGFVRGQGFSPPRKTPLAVQRFGATSLGQGQATDVLKPWEMSQNVKATSQAQHSLGLLATLIREYELQGRGIEVRSLLPERRLRGLDVLYSGKKGAAMLSHAEKEQREQHERVTLMHGAQRAEQALKNCTFFTAMEVKTKGIILQLSKYCKFLREAKDQVIFRQGDPPGNCYVVVHGKVAIRIFQEAEETPTPRHDHRLERFNTLTEVRLGGFQDEREGSEGSLELKRKSFVLAGPKDAEAEKKAFEELGELVRVSELEAPRYISTEGFSSFVPAVEVRGASETVIRESKMGSVVASLGKGSVFGEMALQNDAHRGATVQCLEDTELLVIPKKIYRRVIKKLKDEADRVEFGLKTMRNTEFFQNLESQQPGITAELAGLTMVETHPAGQVLFRQQDPSSKVYILCEGEVEVRVCKPEDVPTEGATKKQGSKKMTPRLCSDYNLHSLLTMEQVQSQIEKGFGGRLQETSKGKHFRFLTSEGFSSFSQVSHLGKLVATLKAPRCFGEASPTSNLPRNASILCKTEVRVITLAKHTFQRAMMEVMARLRFFNDRLPGSNNPALSQRHPSTLFRDRSFPAGYVFMNEGISMSEPAIYLIKSGTVEFRRYRACSENPAYVLSGAPLDESSWQRTAARPPTGVAGSRRAASAALRRGMLASRSGRKQRTPRADFGEEICYDELGSEGIFCSLPFFPMTTGEPFTVVAKGPVECFHAGGSSMQKMPEDVKSKIRKILLKQLKARILRLPPEEIEDEGVYDYLASPGRTSSSFYKNLEESPRRRVTYQEYLESVVREFEDEAKPPKESEMEGQATASETKSGLAKGRSSMMSSAGSLGSRPSVAFADTIDDMSEDEKASQKHRALPGLHKENKWLQRGATHQLVARGGGPKMNITKSLELSHSKTMRA